jgi:hypothetical protein
MFTVAACVAVLAITFWTDRLSDREAVLRVCPKTSGGITKFSQHEAD